MQRSGFFNAVQNDGIYDRTYNANDYCDNLAVVISSGVLRSENDDLKVTADGLITTVAAGRAWINGRYYVNDSPYSFAAASVPAGGARYDRVFLRLNTDVSARSIELVYREGTAANTPEKPAPVREGEIYELALADIYIAANATSVTVTDTRADETLCGWVYSVVGDGSFFTSLDNLFNEWFTEKKSTLASTTLFKKYSSRIVLDEATNIVNFNISQYDEETCFIEVYVNGIYCAPDIDYTLSGSVITFVNSLIATTEIIINVYKSIDGTGIMSVSDEITALQNALAALSTESEYTYICNGVDDNVKISEIAQAWLDGGDDYSSKKINVVGTFGATAPYGGSGDSSSFYRWLSLGGQTVKNRKLIFDFSNCSQIDIPIEAGTMNTIFFGVNVHIIGANVIANQTGTGAIIRGFSDGSNVVAVAENCRFWFNGYSDTYIARSGTYINCRASVSNITGNSFCFFANTYSLLRIYGGEYYAYAGSTSYSSAVVNQTGTNSVSILNAVNAPTDARSGYYQTNSIIQQTGGGILSCTDLISALPLSVISGASNIRGTIAKSKAGLM